MISICPKSMHGGSLSSDLRAVPRAIGFRRIGQGDHAVRDLRGRRIAILATDGFEEIELLEPKEKLSKAGATVQVISPKPGRIRSWKFTDWGRTVQVDRTIDVTSVDAYDALVLPGGLINPDRLRADPQVVAFVRAFAESGKPVAAICRGPWLLVEAGLLRGRRATPSPSIRTDLRNSGADWIDEPVVVNGNLITSRKPGDLVAFIDKVAEPHRALRWWWRSPERRDRHQMVVNL